jgi:hypothetical protein
MSERATSSIRAIDLTSKPLMSRRGFIARHMMRRVMVLDVGQRIPGIDSMANEYEVGFGTVQEAVELITRAGAATFSRHGAQGTLLDSLDWRVAWTVAGLPNLIGSLPLPYTKRYEGLATALHGLLAEAGTPTTLSYMRGGARRLEAVADGHADFAVTSLFSAERFRESTPDAVSTVISLPAQTFVREHGLVFAERSRKQVRPGDRMGVDRDSLDQMLLTEMEASDVAGEVTLVEMPYGHILDGLAQGEIDVAVWNPEEVSIPGLSIQPLRSAAAHDLAGADTQAVVVARSDDELTRRALTLCLCEDDVVAIQREVISGQRQARY